jgi:hypothetical protein
LNIKPHEAKLEDQKSQGKAQEDHLEEKTRKSQQMARNAANQAK